MVQGPPRFPRLPAVMALAALLPACGRPAPVEPPAPAACAWCGAPGSHPEPLPVSPAPPGPAGAFARLGAKGNADRLYLLSFLPEGGVIAACESGLSIGLRDAVTEKELFRHDISEGSPRLFSRNGRVLAILALAPAPPRRVLSLWESITGRPLFGTADFYY